MLNEDHEKRNVPSTSTKSLQVSTVNSNCKYIC